ncbi:hypothetical protein BH10PAT2_BH10PAT2_0630 [soil metagenome]
MTDETYDSINEVAKLLKVAYLTVYRWIRAGKLQSVRAGKQYRISKVELDTFVNSHK